MTAKSPPARSGADVTQASRSWRSQRPSGRESRRPDRSYLLRITDQPQTAAWDPVSPLASTQADDLHLPRPGRQRGSPHARSCSCLNTTGHPARRSLSPPPRPAADERIGDDTMAALAATARSAAPRKQGAGACSMLANLGFVSRLDVSSVAYRGRSRAGRNRVPAARPRFRPRNAHPCLLAGTATLQAPERRAPAAYVTQRGRWCARRWRRFIARSVCLEPGQVATISGFGPRSCAALTRGLPAPVRCSC